MSLPSLGNPDLHVEGEDDLHAIAHLLIQHGIDYDTKRSELPQIRIAGSVQKLLDGVQTAVILSNKRAVGFVLDADSPLLERWREVRERLATVQVETPETPLANGFIGSSEAHLARVGVWLMPDNQQDGKLETFLQTLVAERDRLLDHSKEATCRAKQLGARFTEADQDKAVIRAWLAWQEEPGMPYGRAIRRRYFRHKSPAANAFVAWFRSLYGIQDRAPSGPDPSS